MTMTFSLHGSIAPEGAVDHMELQVKGGGFSHSSRPREDFHLSREKLCIAAVDNGIDRPRLQTILLRSMVQYPATLLVARAGAGKTAAAADLAAHQASVSWLTIGSADTDWPVFARYFSACLDQKVFGPESEGRKRLLRDPQEEIAGFLLDRFLRVSKTPKPALIVLDDVHHIFDAKWFDDFFSLLLYSLPPMVHVMLLCRSKPPQPLWRLRSKQMLNVVDEKVLSFDEVETIQLFNRYGLSAEAARTAHTSQFGRLSKLLEYIQESHPAVP